ncbi:MAG: hypothetical protein RLZZ60_1029 [Bacteroidota bacterium]|jgi:hypothetical protein
MKKLLLAISCFYIVSCHCKHDTCKGVNYSSPNTNNSKNDSLDKKKTIRVIRHGSPDQNKIDSIRNSYNKKTK